jgi:hypothetical protein
MLVSEIQYVKAVVTGCFADGASPSLQACAQALFELERRAPRAIPVGVVADLFAYLSRKQVLRRITTMPRWVAKLEVPAGHSTPYHFRSPAPAPANNTHITRVESASTNSLDLESFRIHLQERGGVTCSLEFFFTLVRPSRVAPALLPVVVARPVRCPTS